MKIRYITLIIFSILTFYVNAQLPQKGIAVEINSGKKPVSDVFVNIQGAQPTYTDYNGLFSLMINGSEPGKKIIVRDIVSKTNYIIVNKDEIFGRWVISKDIDPWLHRIEIVHKDSIECWKLHYKKQAEINAKKKYYQLSKQLKQDLDSTTISNIQYAKKLQELEDNFKNVSFQFDDLAERFAYINFDFSLPFIKDALNAFEEGDVDKAISLLDNLDIVGGLESSEQNLKKAQQQLNKSLEERRQWIEAAKTKADIFVIQIKPDSAYKYYEMAVLADTSDFDNVFAFANFLRRQNFHLYAIKLYNQALANSKSVENTAKIFNNLGLAKIEINDSSAVNDLNESLKICEKNNDIIDTCLIATIYHNLGLYYLNYGNYLKSKYYFNKQINDYKACLTIFDIIDYNGLIIVDNNFTNDEFLNNYLFLSKTINIDREESPIIFHNLGFFYCQNKDYDNGILYYIKAINLFSKYNRNCNLKLANTFCCLGDSYSSKGDYINALIYLDSAIIIYKENNNFNNKLLSIAYNSKAIAYNELGAIDSAIVFFEKSKTLIENMSNEFANLKIIYNNLGLIYYQTFNLPKALECYQNALKLSELSANFNEINMCKEIINNIKSIINLVLFTASINEKGVASEKGLKGKYIWLRFEDWEYGNGIDLFKYSQTMFNKSKTIVLLNDHGEIIEKSFGPDIMGIMIGTEDTTNEKSSQILKQYQKWKIRKK